MPDIFEFWKDVGSGDRIHPADEDVLRAQSGTHQFDLHCIPNPFYGPLKSALIVLLYLNPGLSDGDRQAANDSAEQQFYLRQRRGSESLRSQVGLPRKSWWVSRTKRFSDDPEVLRHQVAVLQYCPYHSKSFEGPEARVASMLPSCKIALEWASDVLFPEARARKRVVICLRSPRRWNLQQPSSDGFLFVPRVTRSGYMLNDDMRAQIVGVVRDALSSGADN